MNEFTTSRLRPLLITASVAAVFAAASNPACAQEEVQLQSITVTAQKRTEEMIKVPISAMAMDMETLEHQGVKDVADVVRQVPGVTFQTSDDAGDTNIAIRGIISTVGASTTGIYIDDVPVAVRLDSGVGSNAYPKIYDLDRLEVLRGPQGTLYGAGAEGGAVRFITPEASLRKMSGFASADIAQTRGGDMSYEAGGAVGGPILEGKLGYRASVWHRQEGGFGDRVDPATGNNLDSRTNSSDATVAHLALKYAATPDLVITPSVLYQKNHIGDTGLFLESAGTYDISSRINQPHDDQFTLSTLAVDYDFGRFTFKSVSSYIDRKVDQVYDGTPYELGSILGTGAVSVPFDPNYLVSVHYMTQQQGVTQEFRFTSADQPGDRLSWVGGLFYRKTNTGYTVLYMDPGFEALTQYLGGTNSLNYWGEAPIDGIYSYLENYPLQETDLAAFADATYAVTDKLKVAVGLRVARSGFSYRDFQDGPWGPAAPFYQSGSQAETPITPRLNATYQLDRDRMVYASIAKGYRTGGSNEPVPTNPNGGCGNDLANLGISQVPLVFKSDSLWSYELGLKGKFADKKVMVESSLYWINWSQIQQSVNLPTCGYYYIGNLGHAVSRGFDAQVEWAVSKYLELSATAGYTDAHLTDSLTVSGVPLTKAGDRLGTPTWSFTTGLEYRFGLWDGADGYARMDYDFSGSFNRMGSVDTYGVDPLTRYVPPSRYLTARVGTKFDGWELAAYANNLLDQDLSTFRYRTSTITGDLKDARLRPMTVGVSAKFKF